MQTTLIFLLFLASMTTRALAAIFITNPVATTIGQGGQNMTLQWMDDGAAPSLADIGPCEIGLYSGNMEQQTELQSIAPSVNVSTQMIQSFIINSTIGPNSPHYFIRITSLDLKDPQNPAYPYEAFSALFTLASMSGEFPPAVQAQIDGVTSASAPATPTPSPAAYAAPALAKASTITNVPVSSAESLSTVPKPTQTSATMMTRGDMGVLRVVGVVAMLATLVL
ncbi:hypothetical protein K439DRAFT_1354734 [Ramaria rubella]|nr:hypothetical protein K439DRAFT_1354734 [Ramaria rubella]